MAQGDLYLLNLHSLAFHQSPLYGSGGGRWFFKSPADPTKPLMDVSSIFQGGTNILTGQLSGLPSTSPTLAEAYISPTLIRYADWNGDPTTGTLYVDRTGQYPATVSADADRAARLAGALRLPQAPQNIGTAQYTTCAITGADGSVQCWGDNAVGTGMFGNGTSTSSDYAVAAVSGVKAQQISGGDGFQNCAITTAGALKCWGNIPPGWGQTLMKGSTNWTLSPTQVPGLTSGVTAVVSGNGTSCAVQNGGLFCWGVNYRGAVGNGTTSTTEVDTPTSVVGLSSGVVNVASAGYATCALTVAGGVKCWGAYYMGNGTYTTPQTTPVDLPGFTSGVVAITGRDNVSDDDYSDIGGNFCLLTNAGTVYCWGANNAGQLGNGTYSYTAFTTTPSQVVGLSNIIQVSMAGYSVCALNTAGGVQCWGFGYDGEMGNGVTNTLSIPYALSPTTPTGLGSGVASIVAGVYHFCARLTGGGIDCWGANNMGQLGDGTTTQRNTPVAVSTKNGPVSNVSPLVSQGTVPGSRGDVERRRPGRGSRHPDALEHEQHGHGQHVAHGHVRPARGRRGGLHRAIRRARGRVQRDNGRDHDRSPAASRHGSLGLLERQLEDQLPLRHADPARGRAPLPLRLSHRLHQVHPDRGRRRLLDDDDGTRPRALPVHARRAGLYVLRLRVLRGPYHRHHDVSKQPERWQRHTARAHLAARRRPSVHRGDRCHRDHLARAPGRHQPAYLRHE